MRLTKNFIIQEFVPEDVYKKYEQSSIWFIDPKIPLLAQFIRDWFENPVSINNWYLDGDRRNSGFRVSDCTVGSKLSQHRFGRAFDFRIASISPEEIREVIRDNYTRFHDTGLTTIEKDTSTWVHVDVRTTINPSKLFEVPYR